MPFSSTRGFPCSPPSRHLPSGKAFPIISLEALILWRALTPGVIRRTAAPILRGIVSRGRTPLVVGGTGLYLKALLGGLDELPGSDPALRSELAELDLPTLVERLRQADVEAPGQIDLANRRRVERALEIVLLTGKPLAASRTQRSGVQKSEVDDASSSVPLNLPSSISYPQKKVMALLVTREREELNARIAGNVEAMFDRGVETKVAALPKKGWPDRLHDAGTQRNPLAPARRDFTRRGDGGHHSCDSPLCQAADDLVPQPACFPDPESHGFPDPDQAVEQALQLLIL